MENDIQWCAMCAQNGEKKRIRHFQINFDEAIVLCENVKCPYPLGSDFTVVKRKASELTTSKKKKVRRCQSSCSSAASSPTLLDLPKPGHGICAVPQFRNISKEQPKNAGTTDNVAPLINTKLVDNKTIPSIGNNQSQLNGHSVCAIKKQFTAFKPFVSGVRSTLDSSKHGHVASVNTKAISESVLCNQTLEYSKDGHSRDNSDKLLQNNVDAPATSTWIDKSYLRYPQWLNKDAMCWLDVGMCLLVHCLVLQHDQICDSIIKNVLKTYTNSLMMVNPVLEDGKSRIVSLDKENVSVKLGGGHLPQKGSILDSENVTSGASPTSPNPLPHQDVVNMASRLLDSSREQVFQYLQPRLKCVKGQHDSPLFAMDTLLRESDYLSNLFKVDYRWEMRCDQCGHEQIDKYTDVIPSLPAMNPGFSMVEPYFTRSCFKCQLVGQQRRMQFDRLPKAVLFHFTDGLPHSNLSEYDFTFKGDKYQVTGLIQHKTGPHHFVAWIRDPIGNTWMECDDLQSSVSQFIPTQPQIPPSQVHIIMWEVQPDQRHGYTHKARLDLSNDVPQDVSAKDEMCNPPAISRSQIPTVSSHHIGNINSACVQNLNNTRVPTVRPLSAGVLCPSVAVASSSCAKPIQVTSIPIIPTLTSQHTANPGPIAIGHTRDASRGVKDVKTRKVLQSVALLHSMKSKQITNLMNNVSHLCAPNKPPSSTTNTSVLSNKNHTMEPGVNHDREMKASLVQSREIFSVKTSFKGYVSKKQKLSNEASEKQSTPSSPVNASSTLVNGKSVQFILNDKKETSMINGNNDKTSHLNVAFDHDLQATTKNCKDNNTQNELLNSAIVSNTVGDSKHDDVLAQLYKVLDIDQDKQTEAEHLDKSIAEDFINNLFSPNSSMEGAPKESVLESQVIEANIPPNMDLGVDDFDIDTILFS